MANKGRVLILCTGNSARSQTQAISPAVARDKMVFTMIETIGSIWMATLNHH